VAPGSTHSIHRDYPADEQDKDLKAKLLEELPGILAWAVEGCLQWQRGGLGQATAVEEATDSIGMTWMDSVGMLRSAASWTPTARVLVADLYDDYTTWLADFTGMLPKPRFGEMLRERADGIESRKVGGKQWWYGIRLKGDVA